MSFSLIRSIAAQPWLIEPDYAQQVAPFIAGLLSGNTIQWDQQENVTLLIASSPATAVRSAGSPADDISPGSVAIYKIQGPLMKQDQFCGPKGMDSMAAEFEALDANTNVDAIVLQINSPGGTVAGTESLARTIAGMKKPVIAYVDGSMSSAAYWVGSSAKHIMMSGRTSAVGSIGTLFSMADVQPVLEKAGVKFHTIRATRSTDKNADYELAMQGSYDNMRTKVLDPLNKAFTESVEANRSGKIDLAKEDVLTGKMYLGKAAIKAGLADSMGSLQDAVAMARKLSKSPVKSIQMKIHDTFPRMSTVAAIDAEAETLENGSVEMTALEMQAIEAALHQAAAQDIIITGAQEQLTAAQQEVANMQEALTTEQAAHATTTTQLTEAQATIATLTAQVATLSEQTPAPENTSRTTDPSGKSKELPSVRYARERGVPC
jgi:signal peptide peptidase SppA